MSAVTDSYAEISLNKEKKPGIYNLIEIASSLNGRPMSDIAEEFKGCGYGELKKYVADVVCEELSKIQKRYHEVIESGELEKVLQEGAQKAAQIANRTLAKVKRKIGLEIR